VIWTPTSVSLSVGAMTGVMAAAADQMRIDNTPLTVGMIAAVVGAAVSYGILRGTVTALAREVGAMRADVRAYQAQGQQVLAELTARVARVEGRMES